VEQAMTYLETLQANYKAVRLRLDPPPKKKPRTPPAPAEPPAVIQAVEEVEPLPIKIEEPSPIPKPVAHQFVLYTVAEAFGVTKDEMIGPIRTNRLVEPRQIAMFLLREVLEYSWTQVGNVFRRDHTTAIHGYRRCEQQRRTGTGHSKTIDQLEDLIRCRLGKPRNHEFRFVLHHRVEDYLKLGWFPTTALQDTHHGHDSVLMKWLCPSCPPIVPKVTT
jgi:hypothetical protein